jgi:hypothetical protein
VFLIRPRYLTKCRYVGDPQARICLDGFDRVKLPRGLLPLDALRALPCDKTPPLCPGVYFLWRGPQLLYVGQTYCLNERLDSHWCAKVGLRTGKRIPFSWRSWIVLTDKWVGEAQRMNLEANYIRAYLPPYNEKIP